MHPLTLALSLAPALPLAAAAAAPNWRQFPLAAGLAGGGDAAPDPPEVKRVEVTLYAMSRCPDARMCENVFEEVIKNDATLDKMDLRIDFLGKPDADATYGVTCMHGDIECAGNAHQLCLEEHLDTKQFWATLSCMNYGRFPGSIGSVALTRRCAETSNVDWWKSGVGRCIQGQRAEREGRAAKRQIKQDGRGSEVYPVAFDAHDDAPPEHLGSHARKLLRQSVRRTAKADATKSCTIDIKSTIKHEGRRRCIVDGGVWKGCDDGHTPAAFAAVVDQEWRSLNDLN